MGQNKQFCGATQIDENHPLNLHNHAARVDNGHVPSTTTHGLPLSVALISPFRFPSTVVFPATTTLCELTEILLLLIIGFTSDNIAL